MVVVERRDVKGEMMRKSVGEEVDVFGGGLVAGAFCGAIVIDELALLEAFFAAPQALSLPSASFTLLTSLP